jgi:drug/metabolite transporter (DMT)-like permease
MNSALQPKFLSARVLVPFLIVTLIWGSTWIVIKGQLGVVPASWSVTYRFIIAGLTMLGYAAIRGESLKIDRSGLVFGGFLGLAQFVFNFNFVYHAEQFVTSGLVAVIFALLFVPNAIFSRLFLGTRMSARFILGSCLSVAGIAILFINEARGDSASQAATLAGIGFTLCGVVSASIANVMQATERARAYPMATMLGWSMLFGAAVDGLYAWLTSGPPIVDPEPAYFAGIAYLGVVASAFAFSLYFQTIRDIGPARASYSSVLIPVIAMAFSTAFEGFYWTGLAALGSGIALVGMIVALGGKAA